MQRALVLRSCRFKKRKKKGKDRLRKRVLLTRVYTLSDIHSRWHTFKVTYIQYHVPSNVTYTFNLTCILCDVHLPFNTSQFLHDTGWHKTDRHKTSQLCPTHTLVDTESQNFLEKTCTCGSLSWSDSQTSARVNVHMWCHRYVTMYGRRHTRATSCCQDCFPYYCTSICLFTQKFPVYTPIFWCNAQ